MIRFGYSSIMRNQGVRCGVDGWWHSYVDLNMILNFIPSCCICNSFTRSISPSVFNFPLAYLSISYRQTINVTYWYYHITYFETTYSIKKCDGMDDTNNVNVIQRYSLKDCAIFTPSVHAMC